MTLTDAEYKISLVNNGWCKEARCCDCWLGRPAWPEAGSWAAILMDPGYHFAAAGAKQGTVTDDHHRCWDTVLE